MCNFRTLIENAHIENNHYFHKIAIVTEPPKIHRNSMFKRIEKECSTKKSKNQIWESIWASQRSQKQCKTKPVWRRHGNHADLIGSQGDP